MPVAEILEQAKALSPQERRELMKLLVETMDENPTPLDERWNQTLERLLHIFDASDWDRLGVDNPVAWVARYKSRT